MRQADGLENTKLFWFDSAAEMAAEADKMPRGAKSCDRGWTGETWSSAVASAMTGSTAHVAAAERLLEQVATQVESPRSTWDRSVCGAYAVVPEALMGMPDPMRRRVSASDNRAPVRIFVDLVTSCGLDVDTLRKRGVACLALAMALGAERPVELYGVVALGSHGEAEKGALVFRIAEGVLDLSVACNALTSVGLARGIGYSYIWHHVGHHTDWMFGYYPDENMRPDHVRRMRAILGCGDFDVYLPPCFLTDEAVRNPVEFVRRSINEHRAMQEAA